MFGVSNELLSGRCLHVEPFKTLSRISESIRSHVEKQQFTKDLDFLIHK